MEILEKKLECVDTQITHLKIKYSQQLNAIENDIEKIFNLAYLTQKINAKRNQLLENLSKDETHSFLEARDREKLSQNVFRSNQTDSIETLLRLHNLGRIFMQNELNVFKKLFYVKIYNPIKYIDLANEAELFEEFHQLTPHRLLAFNRDNLTFKLYNQSLKLLKTLSLIPKFTSAKKSMPIFMYINNYKILLVITKKLENELVDDLGESCCYHTIYILDHNLYVIKSKRFDSTYELVKSNFNKSVIMSDFSNEKLITYDFELNSDVECRVDENFVKTIYMEQRLNVMHLIRDRIFLENVKRDSVGRSYVTLDIILVMGNKLVNIISLEDKRLKKLMAIDSKLNLYFEGSEANNTKWIFCYNSEGSFLFKSHLVLLERPEMAFGKVVFINDNFISFKSFSKLIAII